MRKELRFLTEGGRVTGRAKTFGRVCGGVLTSQSTVESEHRSGLKDCCSGNHKCFEYNMQFSGLLPRRGCVVQLPSTVFQCKVTFIVIASSVTSVNIQVGNTIHEIHIFCTLWAVSVIENTIRIQIKILSEHRLRRA